MLGMQSNLNLSVGNVIVKIKLSRKEQQKQWYLKNKKEHKERYRQWYLKNKKEHKERCRQWYLNNKKQKNEKSKQWSLKNKERHSELNKQWYLNNREKVIERQKQWRLNNIEKAHEQAKQWRLKNKNSIRIKHKKRRHTDIVYKLTLNLRRRVLLALQGKNKSSSTLKLLGCTPEFLKKYLESKFKQGMSWDNRHEWHIDHIRPCASFDLMDPQQQVECFHYTNLQPLWAKENMSKGAKW